MFMSFTLFDPKSPTHSHDARLFIPEILRVFFDIQSVFIYIIRIASLNLTKEGREVL